MSKLVTMQVFTSEVREETLDGRVYLVAPVVAVKNGVLNKIYLSSEELLDVPVDLWNDIPLPVSHPKEGSGSARTVAVVESDVVGRFYNARYEISGNDVKLKGELWVDIEKALSSGEGGTAVVNLLREGKPLEVSTAYFNDEEQASGVFNGERYEAIARNLKPDHLALLPGEIGACSWADGCGAPRVNQEIQANIRSEARTPEYDGTESSAWEAPSLADMIAGYVKHTGGDKPESSITKELPIAVKAWIASKSLLGEATADDTRDLIFFPVVNPSTDKLNENALKAVLGGRGAQADIPEAAKESAQTKARALLEKEFKMGKQTANADKCELSLLKRLRKMILGVNTMDRDAMVAELVESGVDAAILEGASDEAVSLLHERSKQEDVEEVTEVVEETVEAVAEEIVPAVNAETVIDGVRLGDIARFVKNKQAEVAEEHSGLVAALVANERCTLSKEVLEAASPCLLKELVANFAPGNYFGAGMPRGPVQQVPAPPSIVLRKVGE